MNTKRILQGIFWILVYIILTLAPVFILIVGERPPGREIWRDFSVALGYCGLTMWMLQFVLTARFKTIKAPYGSDIVYYFHKQISLVSYYLVLAHVLILLLFSPRLINLFNIITAPWRARAAVTSLVAITLLIIFSVYRKKLKIEYTKWRIWHGILAIMAVSLAFAHVYLVGYYLNTLWKRELWIVYSVFWIGLLFYVRVLKPWFLFRNPYIIDKVVSQRGLAFTLQLRPKKGRGFHFQAGQFAWITANQSPFADAEHPFTIASSAENPDLISFTIKELGDFTSTIKNLESGQEVYIDGPFGSFSYERHPYASGFMFIAGGIGITPMMSMIRTLADRKDLRPLVLIYANKDWEGITFREEIEVLQSKLNLKVIHVLEQTPEKWSGEKGFVTAEIIKKNLPTGLKPNEWEIFICGPLPMMNAIENAMPKVGVAIGDYHSERFDLV
jgi:predicted ferric reductase